MGPAGAHGAVGEMDLQVWKELLVKPELELNPMIQDPVDQKARREWN